MTKPTKPKPQAARDNTQTDTIPTARLATSGGKAPEPDIYSTAAALNARGACLMAFSEFLDSGTDEEIELLHSVLAMRAEGIYKNEPLEGLMSQAAYYGERHRDEIDKDAENERKAVRAFVDIYRANQGCSTPAESLVVTLVWHFESGVAITPKVVDAAAEEFRTDYGSALAADQRLLRFNHKLVTEAIAT